MWSRDRSGVRRGYSKTTKEASKCDVLSQSPDLAKLNPQCHMNYSIIFTEISFYPGTSNLFKFYVPILITTCIIVQHNSHMHGHTHTHTHTHMCVLMHVHTPACIHTYTLDTLF